MTKTYWEWMHNKAFIDREGDTVEMAKANPDVLDETCSLYYVSDERLEVIFDMRNVIRKGIKELSKREKQIVELLVKGYSVKQLENKLHLRNATIRTSLKRAREKLVKFVTKRLVDKMVNHEDCQ